MEDGTASTQRVYYPSRRPARPSSQNTHASQFLDALGDRDDHGAPAWDAITQALDTLPEAPPATPYVPPALPTTGDAVVYYLRFGDRIKIGTSVNLRKRLEAIPHDQVLATEPGSYEVERHRHAQFVHLRVRGEWFRAEPDLLEFIATLA